MSYLDQEFDIPQRVFPTARMSELLGNAVLVPALTATPPFVDPLLRIQEDLTLSRMCASTAE